MRMIGKRVAIGSIVALALAVAATAGAATAGAAAGPASAAVSPSALSSRVVPSLAAVSWWGYAVARHPTTTDYNPAAVDRGNSSLGTVHVHRSGTGAYTVAFVGLAANGGTVHVTALGGVLRYCDVQDWGPSGGDELVDIQCYSGAGAPANAMFSVNFLSSGGNPGKLAYLWADQPSATNYSPAALYQFNSTGGTNTIHRSGVGTYTAVLPGLGSFKGDVQVTAYGNTGATCRVVSWGSASAAQQVRVQCRGPNGTLSDQSFDLTFTQNLGLRGFASGKAAYLWASKPATTSYTPVAAYRFSTSGFPSHVTRTGTGRYTVSLKGIAGHGGSAQVTAYGSGKIRCELASIATSGATQTIGVRCYSSGGGTADSKFTLSYAR